MKTLMLLISLIVSLCMTSPAQSWANVPGTNVWYDSDSAFISVDQITGDMTVAWLAAQNWNRAPVEVRPPSVFQSEWELCLTGTAFLVDPNNPLSVCFTPTTPTYTDWFGNIRQGNYYQGMTHNTSNFGAGSVYFPSGANAQPLTTRYSPQLYMWWSPQRPEVRFNHPMVQPTCPSGVLAVPLYAITLRLTNTFN